MTKFEEMLMDRGYLQFILNCKTMKFEPTKKHIISTMVNLDHRYFHKTDKNVLRKISEGKSVMDEDFTWEDRKGEICFGLSEYKKPPTLVSPRPKIEVKRTKIINGEEVVVYENESLDDSMNLVLSKETPERIFEAMYDKSICFEIDLT